MTVSTKSAVKSQAKRGAGMTEYILIVALVAIAAIGVVGTFGNNVRGIFNASTNGLAGMTNQATGNAMYGTKGKDDITDFADNNANR